MIRLEINADTPDDTPLADDSVCLQQYQCFLEEALLITPPVEQGVTSLAHPEQCQVSRQDNMIRFQYVGGLLLLCA